MFVSLGLFCPLISCSSFNSNTRKLNRLFDPPRTPTSLKEGKTKENKESSELTSRKRKKPATKKRDTPSQKISKYEQEFLEMAFENYSSSFLEDSYEEMISRTISREEGSENDNKMISNTKIIKKSVLTYLLDENKRHLVKDFTDLITLLRSLDKSNLLKMKTLENLVEFKIDHDYTKIKQILEAYICYGKNRIPIEEYNKYIELIKLSK